jgi:hypothetical protein
MPCHSKIYTNWSTIYLVKKITQSATNKDFVNSHTTVLLLTLPYRMTADDLMGVISQRMIGWSDERMTTVTLLFF